MAYHRQRRFIEGCLFHKLALYVLLCSALSSLELVMSASPPNAATGAGITVDGNTSDWLASDFFAHMYQAGRNSKPNLTDLYVRYNCTTNTLYVLVLATAGNTIDADSAADNQHVKINGAKQVDGAGGGVAGGAFAWVNNTGTDADGWEASFPLGVGDYTDQFLVHAQANDSTGASQTSATTEDDNANNREIDLTISCTGGGGSTGSVKITENTVPDGPQDFAYTTTGTGLSNFSLDDDGTLSNMQTFSNLDAGAYGVTQTLASGFDLTDIVCTGATSSTITIGAAGGFDAGDTSVSINLAAGENIECTFTNQPQATATGSITIVEDTVPDGPQDFDFNATGGLSPSSFSLDDDANATLSNSEVFSNLSAGTYSVTQDFLGGFNLTNIVCSGGISVTIGSDSDFDSGDQQVTINLQSGENVTCTFTNTQPNAAPQYDYGDLPDGLGGPSYPTLNGSTGAKHLLGSGLLMGKKVDDESDGQPDVNAQLDDKTAKDEDGAEIPAILLEGSTPSFNIPVKNPTSSLATLVCWIDYDKDGGLDISERALATVPANTNTTATITFGSPVPVGATATTGGFTYARCRISTDGILPPDGSASDGEVEDFKVRDCKVTTPWG